MPIPASAITFSCTHWYVSADAIFLPLKSEKKLVVELEKVPELPNPLIWHARPRYAVQAVLAVVEGEVKYCPVAPVSSTVGTFWKTLPSTST